MASTKIVFKDFSGASNTTGGSGSAPYAGSASIGGGVGFLDLGNPSGQSIYYIDTGVLKNDYLGRSPGNFLFDSVSNGCVRSDTAEKFQDGQVWVQANGSDKLGLLARADATGASEYGIGGLIEGGTFYIWAKNSGGSTILNQSQAIGTSTPSDARFRLKVTNSGGNNVTIRISQYTSAAFDPSGSGEPDSATETAFYEYVYNASSNTAVLASGAAGVFSYNSGSIKNFASYVVSTVLAMPTPTVTFRGSECITINVATATGGSGTKVYDLERRVSGGSWSTLTAGISTGDIDDTTVVPGTSYEYRVTVTDGSGTDTSDGVAARALLTTEPCLVVIGDSNLDPTFGSVTPRAYDALVQWLAGLNVDATAKSFAIAGTTSAMWKPGGLQAGTLANAVTWGNKYGATHYIRVLGTNDAKTAVATTQSDYNTNTAALEAYVFANATTSPKILHGTPGFINGAAAGAEWDAASDGLIQNYIAALQGRVGGSVYLMDDPATVTSWHDAGEASPSTYGLAADVHYTSVGHYRQALAWEQGYWANFYGAASGGGSNEMTVTDTIKASLTTAWAEVKDRSAASLTGSAFFVGFANLRGQIVEYAVVDAVENIQIGTEVSSLAPMINAKVVGTGKKLFMRSKSGVSIDIPLEVGTA